MHVSTGSVIAIKVYICLLPGYIEGIYCAVIWWNLGITFFRCQVRDHTCECSNEPFGFTKGS